MFKQQLRIVKTIKKTKEGREFPNYVALYDKGGSIGYIDVSFTKNTLNDYIALCKGKTYADVVLSFGEGKEDKDKENAFIADKRKKNSAGGYDVIKDRHGNPIPHIVIMSIDESCLMKAPILLPQKEKKDIYSPKDFFHRSGEKNVALSNITGSDLPF